MKQATRKFGCLLKDYTCIPEDPEDITLENCSVLFNSGVAAVIFGATSVQQKRYSLIQNFTNQIQYKNLVSP
jgi:hypothetical protein